MAYQPVNFDIADDLGRTAAHMSVTKAQLEAMCDALRLHSAMKRRAVLSMCNRLIWMAEGMGINEADPSFTDAEIDAAEAA